MDEISRLVIIDGFARMADLKKQDLGNILVYGSGDLVQTLVKHDLVDEYDLMVFPIVLGSGLRLFRDDATIPKLRLVDSKTYKTGVVLLTYQPGKDGK
ncbi:MAG: dihydrofolate reductase family protein [Dehalococcoidia bacterium]